MTENHKEVRFDIWCDKCVHSSLNEKFDPCNDCLAEGGREGTVKPLYFESKEDKHAGTNRKKA